MGIWAFQIDYLREIFKDRWTLYILYQCPFNVNNMGKAWLIRNKMEYYLIENYIIFDALELRIDFPSTFFWFGFRTLYFNHNDIFVYYTIYNELYRLPCVDRVKTNRACRPVAIAHYDDVIMTMLASQITSLTVVYSIVYSGVNQRKHQSSASLAFVREIHWGPVNFPHKWPVTRKMFPFDDVIM